MNAALRLPSDLDTPAFLMAAPHTFGIGIPNNAWMKADDRIDLQKAWQQWTALYQRLAREGIVYLLPSEGEFQDRCFCADIGAWLPHKPDCFALSRIETLGRVGEEIVAGKFMRDLGYRVARSPARWEGSSELKHLRGRTYIGGIGERSSAEAFEWLSETFEAEIVTVRLNDPKAYHLDGCLFPLTDEAILMTTSLFDKADVAKVEKIAEVISVPRRHAYADWTNVVRLGSKILYNGSVISADDLQAAIGRRGFEVERMDLSEFELSGAGLSCAVLSLNDCNRQ